MLPAKLLCILIASIIAEAGYIPPTLTCYCNECPEDFCVTKAHEDSFCFKSVERQIENNSFIQVQRFGCLSGSNNDLISLQCHANTLRHREPVYIACCNEGDRCNQDLPDPDPHRDPRWNETPPPPSPMPGDASTNWVVPVVLVTISLTCLALITIQKLYLRYKELKETQDSINSLRASIWDDPLKTQMAVDHSPGGSSISDSKATYSEKHYHCEQSLSMTENIGTEADLTSGVGPRILEPRTMARVVNNGATQPIGCGRFGRVFRGVFNDSDVAVKAFLPIDFNSWQRESKILMLMNHPNIVRYIATEMHTVAETQLTETWMFLEFCPYGSLCDFLDQYEISGPQQAIKILNSIIEGLYYLHEDYSTGGGKPQIAHRDIKSKNILMRTPEVCCLADFGHAVIKINDEKLDFGSYGPHRLQVGTVRYLAPEILKPNSPLDTTQFHTFAQADIYQFSLVLWEICNRTALDILHPAQPHRLPYDNVVPQNPDLNSMIKIVCEDNYRPPRLPHWQRYPEMKVLCSLMEECWYAKPQSRILTLAVRKRIKTLNQNNLLKNQLVPHLDRNDFTL